MSASSYTWQVALKKRRSCSKTTEQLKHNSYSVHFSERYKLPRKPSQEIIIMIIIKIIVFIVEIKFTSHFTEYNKKRT